MAYPSSWVEVEAKLKELFPDATERGKIRKRLIDLDESKAFRYFQDEDDSVKSALQELGSIQGGSLSRICFDTEPAEKLSYVASSGLRFRLCTGFRRSPLWRSGFLSSLRFSLLLFG